ncbi:MAG: hypothetical protein R3B48_26570 [Kofleriaceae bacterium]
MRQAVLIVGILLGSSLSGCTCDGEAEGMRQAQRESEEAAKREAATREAPRKLRPPVEGSRKVECTQLIDMTAFGEALGEKQPISVRDVTKTSPQSTSSCSLLRGGEPVSMAAQKALLKRNGRLGVLPGDELCNVTAFCSTIEDPERFEQKCRDLTLGTPACVTIVPHGPDDVQSFRFLDKETKCVIEVRGGPSMVDNDFIATCAKAARDLIGPEQISATPSPVEPTAGAPEGEGGEGGEP